MSLVDYSRHPIINNILLNASYDDIINYCRTYTEAHSICANSGFWNEKASLDFNISSDSFNNTDLSPSQRYLELLTFNGGVAIGSEYYTSVNNCMRRAIIKNRNDIIEHLLKSGFDDWNTMVISYGAIGNLFMVIEYLPLMGVSTNVISDMIEEAVANGHVNIFDFFLNEKINFSMLSAIFGALKYGDIKIFNHILKESSSYIKFEPEFLTQKYIYAAVKSGNLDFIISLLKKQPQINWINLINYSQNKKILRYFYEKAGNEIIDNINDILIAATRVDDNDLFNELFQKKLRENPSYEIDWNEILIESIKNGKNTFANKLGFISSVYDLNKLDWNELIEEAASLGDKDLLDYILSLAGIDNNKDWNKILFDAVKSGNKRLIDYILQIAPVNYNWINWPSLLINPVVVNDKWMFDYIYNLDKSKNINLDWQSYINEVKTTEFLKYIYRILPNKVNIDYQRLAEKAVLSNNNKLFYAISAITINLRWDKMIKTAISLGRYRPNREIIDYVLDNPDSFIREKDY